jgi:hypothetical protein
VVKAFGAVAVYREGRRRPVQGQQSDRLAAAVAGAALLVAQPHAPLAQAIEVAKVVPAAKAATEKDASLSK